MPPKKATNATKAKAPAAKAPAVAKVTKKAAAPKATSTAKAASKRKTSSSDQPAQKSKASAPNAASTAPSSTTKKAAAPAAKTAASKASSTIKKAAAPAAKTAAPKASSTTKAAEGPAAKPTANESKKRKTPVADENEEASRPVKKARVIIPKPSKAAKKGPVINEVPKQRLHVYVFGEGSSGELGLGTAKNAVDVKRPRLNPHLAADTVGVVQIAAGGMHVAALTHDNKILTWGVNDQGALGRDTTWEGGLKDVDANDSDSDAGSDSGLNPKESTPTAIPSDSFPEGTVFVELAAGDSTTFALTDDGLVYGWGTFRVRRLLLLLLLLPMCNSIDLTRLTRK